MVGPSKAAVALQAVVADAARRLGHSKGRAGGSAEFDDDFIGGVREMLGSCLCGKDGKAVLGTDEFVERYFDPKRYSGLALRR